MVDLAYLREHPHQLPTLLAHQRIRETPVPGGSICHARRLTLEDGVSVFVKSRSRSALGDPSDDSAGGVGGVSGSDELDAPAGFFEAEAAGLRWLGDAGQVGVPEVIAVLPQLLVLEWLDSTGPSVAPADRLGRELAGMHRAGANGFGAAWPGFIGALPQDNRPPEGEAVWWEWFAERRLLPYLRRSAQRQALAPADITMIDRVIDALPRLAPPAEPPARLHGDLWPGNLIWAADRVWLIDPAAHGGHRETDLAMLALFGGAPHLDRILAAYQEIWPLADGWRSRVPLHQLHLLLVHTALFGAGYRDLVAAAATAALRGPG